MDGSRAVIPRRRSPDGRERRLRRRYGGLAGTLSCGPCVGEFQRLTREQLFSRHTPFGEYEDERSVVNQILHNGLPLRPPGRGNAQRDLQNAEWTMLRRFWAPNPMLRPPLSSLLTTIMRFTNAPGSTSQARTSAYA